MESHLWKGAANEDIMSVVEQSWEPGRLDLRFGDGATPAQQENSFWWENKQAFTHKPLDFSHCFFAISCAQKSLFCLLHAFSSLSIFPVVSPTTEFTRSPPSLPELESMPSKNLRFPHFSQLIPLPLTLQVTLPEQCCFDTVPLAAIRIKSAPGCL